VKTKRRFTRARIGKSLLIYTAASLVFLWTFAPLAWMLITSFSPGVELLTSPPHWIPENPTVERYEAIFSAANLSVRGAEVASPATTFVRGLINSIVVAMGATLLSLLVGLLAAFAFARLHFRLNRTILFGIVALQMLPSIATVVPIFALFQRLYLTDSLAGLVLVNSGPAVTYIIWLMSSYIRTLPVELEEAARVDGASHFGAYLRITLPIALPGIVAAGTISFLLAWNEFLFALVLSSTTAAKTMPVAISEFSSRFGLDYGMIMTGGVLASIPPVLLAMIFQRYLVQGLAGGAVKG
jgi:multiple sugar transport system permease protein